MSQYESTELFRLENSLNSHSNTFQKNRGRCFIARKIVSLVLYSTLLQILQSMKVVAVSLSPHLLSYKAHLMYRMTNNVTNDIKVKIHLGLHFHFLAKS